MNIALLIAAAVIVGWATHRGLDRRATRRNRMALDHTWGQATGMIASELGAGQTPDQAIRHVGQDLRGDTGQALIHLADQLCWGIEKLVPTTGHARRVAAACQVSAHWGVALAEVMEAASADIEARLSHARRVEASLAGPRMSTLMLMLLPVGGVGLGESMGAGSTTLLVTTTLGGCLVVAATVLTVAGVEWSRALAGRAESGTVAEDLLAAAADADIMAACLGAGLSMHDAVGAVRDVESGHRAVWDAVYSRLELGLGAHDVWKPCVDCDALAEFGRRARRSQIAGTRLVGEIRVMSMHLRDRARDEAVAAAEKAGVLVTLPLSFCFLPAFVLVGLVPMGMGMWSHLS